jgi:2,3-bisphosphoglycerate-independent phosphoglycerate mutase
VFDQSYAAGLTDEYINPHVIHNQGKPIGLVSENDSIISFNHRSDRARQLAKVFVQEEFVAMNRSAFERGASIKNLRFVAMSDFGPDLGDILTAYPSKDLIQTLPMVLSKMSQLYIAETEKYAHITYFFNGGYADPVGGESRIMVNSPNVKHYDDIPGMSTDKIAKKATESILNGEYEFITANIACLDMIAHTGNFDASQVALRSVDSALGKIMNAITKMKGILMVTADHGNIEEMRDLSTSEMDTEHSKNHVPFVIIGHDVQLTGLREEGMLGDVAPTVLDTMNIQKPKEMTGKSLFKGSKP